MNEKVVVLFILGMGAVRLYEDYVDDVDRDDDDEEDRFKRRKISRRDVSNEPVPPVNYAELIVEIQQNGLSPKDLLACDRVVSTECSCASVNFLSLNILSFRRIDCFYLQDKVDHCQKLEKYRPNPKLHLNEGLLSQRALGDKLVWVKICRQTELLGQHLCDCRKYLTKWSEFSGNLSAFTNGDEFTLF
ncbi:unnamed protein product [Dibothriocephalus latus]|uniref:Uncharacterized protein n=1 Tax=Dibothriocephalus latus TaxID=60516 RepID=A0A3P7M7N5_DIBLA|nr:unnamed protein product [Dibothriocephalus latus]